MSFCFLEYKRRIKNQAWTVRLGEPWTHELLEDSMLLRFGAPLHGGAVHMSDSYATEIDSDGLEKVVFDRFTFYN